MWAKAHVIYLLFLIFTTASGEQEACEKAESVPVLESGKGDKPLPPKSHTSEWDHSTDCMALEEAGKIVQCVGNKMTIGHITDVRARQELFHAMRKTSVDTRLYGIGVEVGAKPAILAFKQTVYDVEETYFRIPLTAMRVEKFLILPKETTKPTLVLTKEVPDVAVYGETYLQGSGSKTMAALYKHGKEPVGKECSNVLMDKTLRAFENANGQALLIGDTLWCPDVLRKRFNLIRGDIELQKTQVGGITVEAYAFKWAEGEGWVFGDVLPVNEQDFPE